MACGTPVIAPRFGACLDFCSPKNSFLVPAKRIHLPVDRVFAINTLGYEERIDEVDFCEVPVETLAERMRTVYESPREQISSRGRDAARTAMGSFRWADTVARVEACLQEVASKGIPVRLENRRRLLQSKLSLLNAAREMYLTRIGTPVISPSAPASG
jgi:glycosyltransferase involved in cell wall biosynthesis